MKTTGLLLALLIFAFGCNKAAEESATTGGESPKTASTGGSAEPSGDASGGFAAVQAIFTKSCVGCHGENGKEGVDLRSYDSIQKGGEHGPIVVAGDPAGSLVVKAVRGAQGVDRMPKMGSPLAEEDIQKIEAWIKDGAKN